MKKYSKKLRKYLKFVCGSKPAAKRWLRNTYSNFYHSSKLFDLSENELVNELRFGGRIIL